MKTYKRNVLIGVLASLLLLSGCTLAQRAIVNEGIVKAKEFKDDEARLLVTGLCAISVGAFNRNFDASQRAAINSLCGGE